MHILVTGGTGYIGSHTVLELLQKGYEVTVLDNLSNSSTESLRRVELLTNKIVGFVKGDITDEASLEQIFSENNFSAVIHFAGLKAVGESVINPLTYYENNVFGSIQLFKVMSKYNVNNIVFSSSATVYGEPQSLPLKETMPVGVPTNPYGMSKLMIENILQDIFISNNDWAIVNLRYFNPVGAHVSGDIGEDPNGIPNNLMPFISQTATGKRECLSIFGNDYETKDGTGVRDYIHVVDLALGHIKALDKIQQKPGFYTVNLGTGIGYSVLDIVNTFKSATGQHIPYQFMPRRPGDVAACYADPSYAKSCLDWSATKDLSQMCFDTWRWQSKNPNGYC